MTRWRMEQPCENCPFNKDGPGLALRKSLRPARWREILESLLKGGFFRCHKTTPETGDGSNLVCAGSIAWQAKRRIVADYVQVAERLDAFRRQREAQA